MSVIRFSILSVKLFPTGLRKPLRRLLNMNKTRLTILPILGVFFALFFGWSTSFGQAAAKLEAQFNEILALPAGSVFTLTVSDDEITEAANEYLDRYTDEIVEMIRETAGVKLDVSHPVIEFKTDDATASIRVGKGFLKVTASIRASVVWENDTLVVDVKSVDIPTISVDPATVNSYIQGPVNSGVNELKKYLEIYSFSVSDGYIQLEAMKK